MSTENGETTYYVYGLGLISQENSDGYKLYHYDYRGSTTTITNLNGEVTDTIYYDPYGNIISRTGTTDTPFLYVGQYGVETDDSGLYYMRARYYNPQIQRFINVDPIRDGYNWYLYTDDSPIINIDPSGEVAFIIPAVAVAIGAVAGTAAYQVYSNINRSYRRTVRNYYTPSVSNQYVSENNIDRRIPGYRQLQETLRSTILSTPQDRANALFESVLGYPAEVFVQKTIIGIAPTILGSRIGSNGIIYMNENKNVDKKPTSQSQMQKQVERGQAPKEVDRVDKPHIEGQQPHVHFKDGTSQNIDGSVHDAHRGTPNLTNKVKKWLTNNGWKVND